MNKKRWLTWGLVAACGALVLWRLWRLWPESTRPAMLSKLRSPRRATDPSPSFENESPEPEAASPAEVAAETPATPPEMPLVEEPAALFSELSPKTRVHLNSSSPTELQALPGIGPALAGRIVAARPFDSVDDLARVSGIGPVLIRRVESFVELLVVKL